MLPIDDALDCRGLLCPQPVLRTQMRLRQLPIGATLAVSVTDPLAEVDLAAFCTREGHEWLGAIPTSDGWVVRLRRGTGSGNSPRQPPSAPAP